MKEFLPGFITGIAGLAVGAAGLFGLILWCTGIERFENHYPTFEAARSAGAIERGWLPASLPHEAINISSYGDLDSNISFGSFELPPEAWSDFVSRLAPTQHVPSSFRVDSKSTCAPSDSEDLQEAFELFRERQKSSEYVLAVNENRNCILFSNDR